MAFPLKPPKSWFDIPEADGPMPLTFERSGKVYGHLALYETCHSGFLNGAYSECVKAPRSASGYSMFHLGQLETAEGDMVPIGKLTYDTGHAPLTADLRAASRHYDQTGSVGAFIKARDGEWGIWASGAVRSDLSEEGFRDLRANPPSGDWRLLNHSLEMVAALAVPVPGFPIPHSQLALAASGEVSALVLTWHEEEREERSRAYMRERAVIAASINGSEEPALMTAIVEAPPLSRLERARRHRGR